MITVNLNDRVRFKITEHGKNALRLRSLQTKVNMLRYIGEPDPDGWHSLQLWEFCFYFGPSLYMGSQLPVEATIQIKPI